MKYKQLTKEQFEALHEEFARFLATQQIDVKEWSEIKKNKPAIADEELNIFSDLVWEQSLKNVSYLEHFSKTNINLFQTGDKSISRIVVQVNKVDFDFFKDEDYRWFIDHTKDASITFFKGTKTYTSERNLEIFDLIQKGSIIADGKLYDSLYKLIG